MEQKKLTTKEFVKRSIEKHGEKYDYSNTIYKNKRTKVSIICKVHGEFKQYPLNHLKYGCKECGIIKAAKTNKRTTEEFIKMCNIIHDNKYDYSLVDYNGSEAKVIIICPVHGPFKQIASGHLRGYGCKMCNGNFNGRYSKLNIPLFDIYSNQLLFIGISCRRNKKDKNVLEVKCYKCGSWYIPSAISVQNKLSSSNGTIKYGQNNLYCSDKCKTECKDFGFNPICTDPESNLYIEKTEAQKVRNCQTDIIKQLQCGNDGKMYCERCGNEIFLMDAELHHTLPISQFGIKASDHESQMLVCVKCHLELHNNCK